MKIYQILEHVGLGVVEAPTITTVLPDEIYKDKQKANKRAEELWLQNTTKKDRESGWCPLHYSVKEINVK